MPSGITVTDGMAYVGRTPWHGLGVQVQGEAMTAAQAIEMAGLDWTVSKQQVYTCDSSLMMRKIDDRFAIVRDDTQDVFGIFTGQYTPVQNLECVRWFDELVGSGEAIYHTVGTLFGGRKIWLLGKLNGSYKLDNGEALESYILLSNSHDGSLAFQMCLTPVRVVCSNTLAVANSSAVSKFKAKHTRGVTAKVSQARTLLGLNDAYMQRFMDDCNRIADEAWSQTEMKGMVYDLFSLDLEKSLADQKGSRGVAAGKALDLFTVGTGNGGTTKWDAFNAITEYADYYKGGRAIDSIGAVDEKTVSRRIDDSRSGATARMRERAWEVLTREHAN